MDDPSEAMHDGAYGTHVALLAAALAWVPTGDVLELGAGWWSTPLLARVGRAQRRRIVTADADAEWLAAFERFRGPHHALVHVRDWAAWLAMVTRTRRTPWGVVFVDHFPPEQRGEALLALADHAQILVAHDSDDLETCGYGAVFERFPFRYEDTTARPATIALSRRAPLPW